MADVITFVPQAHLTAQQNLDNFIEMARVHLKVFGAGLDFEADSWNCTATLGIKSTTNKKNVVFSNWKTSGAKSGKAVFMPKPFKTFAKSCIRYRFGLKPTKDIAKRITTLRVLCAALEERGKTNPIYLDASVFDRAAALLPERLSESAWYKHGNEIEAIANFLRENRLTIVPVYWKNPFRKPTDIGKVGEEFNKRRASKMPSPHALNALGRIFSSSMHPTDQVVTSICAIMVTHPERASETLHIRMDCEVERSADGKEQYGLRWWPAKGGNPDVKPIIPAAVDLVKKALARLRKHTEKGRSLAKWYTKHPEKLYLPKELEHLRARDSLTMDEVALIVFDDGGVKASAKEARQQGVQWCRINGVPLFKGECPDLASYARFSEVELAVVGGLRVKAPKGEIELGADGKPVMEWHEGMLPRGFPMANPEQGLPYHDMLLLFPVNYFNSGKATYRCMFEIKDVNFINNHLGRASVADAVSIFQRNSLREEDGSPIDITTHMFRHYLNTLAEMGGMSELDLARWSGRADLGQNKAYQHMSSGEINERTDDLLGAVAGDTTPKEEFSTPATLVDSTGALIVNPGYDLTHLSERNLKLVVQAEFRNLGIAAGHTTMVGYCEHDFAMEPCPKHEDCINCSEKFCVKGDLVREANLRRMRDETAILLENAEKAHREEYYGADRWVDHQKMTLANLNALLSMIDNPLVMPGAVIRSKSEAAAIRLMHEPENVAEAKLLMHGSSHEGMNVSPFDGEDSDYQEGDDKKVPPSSDFVLEF